MLATLDRRALGRLGACPAALHCDQAIFFSEPTRGPQVPRSPSSRLLNIVSRQAGFPRQSQRRAPHPNKANTAVQAADLGESERCTGPKPDAGQAGGARRCGRGRCLASQADRQYVARAVRVGEASIPPWIDLAGGRTGWIGICSASDFGRVPGTLDGRRQIRFGDNGFEDEDASIKSAQGSAEAGTGLPGGVAPNVRSGSSPEMPETNPMQVGSAPAARFNPSRLESISECIRMS